MNKLAIILPAYKITFLEEALNSIANQTCLDFTLYIGNDASPYNIESVIEKYKEKISLVYKRFETNVGGENLVKQWERCINLSQEEEWIWLFSDDDIMHEQCVEAFYSEIKKNNQFDLYHFNVNIIDENNEILKKTSFPPVLSIEDFNYRKFSGKLHSYVVEYIFRKTKFDVVGGFQNFDLAWNSDDATWTKIAQAQGIKTIENGVVNWRKSKENISPNHSDITIVKRKIEANKRYVIWLHMFYKEYHIKSFRLFLKITTWYICSLKQYEAILTQKQIVKEIKDYFTIVKRKFLFLLGILYFKVKKI